MLQRRGRPGDAERSRTLLHDAKTTARDLALPHLEACIDRVLA